MLRHPMANVIIGFVLTGVLGTTLTQYDSMKRQQEAQHQQQIEARKKAVSELSSLNDEVLACAEGLLRALELGDSEHLDELKKLYNDAVLHWKTEHHSTLLIARDVLPASMYHVLPLPRPLEGGISGALSHPHQRLPGTSATRYCHGCIGG